MNEKKNRVKTCPGCDSENVVRVVGSMMLLANPDLREELKAGRAIVCGACCGTGSTRTFQCQDCGLRWNEDMEQAIKESR